MELDGVNPEVIALAWCTILAVAVLLYGFFAINSDD